ncbi:MAG: hypothetical protein ACI9QL_004127 [Candidatus Omnitrophota bacterium]|jgi:hypothetical protein
MNKLKNVLVVAALLVGLTSFVEAGSSRRPTGLSVIVAPANYTVLQVAFDIADNYPALIVSYEDDGDVANPFMHVWNGSSWRRLPAEDYTSGDFLGRRPAQVLVIGDDNALTESLLAKSEGWGSQAYILPKAPLRELMNQLGQRFRFGKREWTYFAQRYKLSLVDMNAEKRKSSWYDGKMPKGAPQGGASYQAIPQVQETQSSRPPTRAVEVYENTTRVVPSDSAITSVTSFDSPVARPVVVEAPTVDAALPTVDAALPAVDAALPTVDAALPAVDAALPTVDAALPTVDAALPTVDAALPTVDAGLPTVRFSTEAYETKVAPAPTTLDNLPAFKGWDKEAIKADPIK